MMIRREKLWVMLSLGERVRVGSGHTHGLQNEHTHG